MPMSSSRGLQHIAVSVLPYFLAQVAAAQGHPIVLNDVTVKCNANDAEILGNVITWQFPVPIAAESQHVFVQRLVPDPPIIDINPTTVFDGPPIDLDSGLPPLSQSFNGPEFGFDTGHGIEVVYTKETDPNHWFVARQANYCLPQLPECPTCWSELEFPNPAPASDNRWGPFSTESVTAAKVVYFKDEVIPRDPIERRLAWRNLEGPDLTEHVIDDPSATFLAVGCGSTVRTSF
jgi:hypothetical protein